MTTNSSFLRYLLCFSILLGTCGLAHSQHVHSCTIMPTDAAVLNTPATGAENLPAGTQKAVSYRRDAIGRGNLWPTGSTIKVRFFGGSPTLRNRVMRAAREWSKYANINFGVVTAGHADVRISFTQNGSSWSTIGRASAYGNQRAPSMNFGWLTDRSPDYEVTRTVLHEFGHALGLFHEHQNPNGGIPWDQEAVYDHYRRTQGWDRKTTYDNVMATTTNDRTQFTRYDASSIMHYPVASELTAGRYSVGMNNGLSPTDKVYIANLYPGRPGAPAVTTTTRPAPRPTTTPQPRVRPRPTPTRPAPPVVAARHRVRIGSALGEGQLAETVELYVGNRKWVIRLDAQGLRQNFVELDLPTGEHRYRVVTRSTYEGYKIVERGGRRYRKLVRFEVPGEGTGVLRVRENQALSLFGRYDERGRRHELFLGVAK